jgi:hypothetical protein
VNSMKRIALAVAALQLFAVLATAGGGSPAVLKPASVKRAPVSQATSKGGGRRRADALLPGVWGGEHVRFEVTDDGATVEFDCAHATVRGRVVVDRAGRFNVAGTYVEEHGGPVRADESSAGVPVRLTGHVGGSLMKLTVTRVGRRKAVGTYSLARDAEPRLVKCR